MNRDPVDEVVCLRWTLIKFYPVERETLFCFLCVCETSPAGTSKNSDVGSRSFMLYEKAYILLLQLLCPEQLWT